MDQVSEQVELSIVMPCLNEARTIGACIRKAQLFCRSAGVSYEVVVGDNGSADESVAISERAGARVVPVSAKGYGSALSGAIRAARGRFVIMGDADDSYDFSDLSPFLQRLREGYELVMGNRWGGGIIPGAMPWKNRWLGNPALTALGRLFFRVDCRDFHCGLRGFTREGFERMAMGSSGMEFATEMVLKAKVAGLRVAEVPTRLWPDGRGGRAPHLRPWRDGWRHLLFMLLHSPRWLFTVPGLLCLVVGLAMSAMLWTGPVRVHNVNFDIDSLLLSSALTIFGYQVLVFSFASQVYGLSEGLVLPSKTTRALQRLFSVNRGIAAGALVVLAGVAWLAGALLHWFRHGLGDLNPAEALRLVIPATLCFAIGSQTILASFHIGVLRLKRGGATRW